MKTRKSFKVNREAAIKIAMNTNGISREIAKKYTDSELKECLRLLKLKTNFYIIAKFICTDCKIQMCIFS